MSTLQEMEYGESMWDSYSQCDKDGNKKYNHDCCLPDLDGKADAEHESESRVESRMLHGDDA